MKDFTLTKREWVEARAVDAVEEVLVEKAAGDAYRLACIAGNCTKFVKSGNDLIRVAVMIVPDGNRPATDQELSEMIHEEPS